MSEEPADVVAQRLRLPPARNKFDEPWRYYLLAYLAALAAIADYEGSHFGHVEAAAALDILIRDAQDMALQLRRRRSPRWIR